MEPKKIEVEEYTALVQQNVNEAEKINAECEKELKVAKPKLEKAEKALDTLDANDIINLRVTFIILIIIIFIILFFRV